MYSFFPKSVRFVCTLAVMLIVGSAPSPLTGSERPNILVIVADDLGYGDLGCYGGKDIPTPHIDQLAREGIRFTSGYVSGPYCSPTRAGLMTGRYQQRFGHEFNPGPNANRDFGLNLQERTLPDRLKAAGYATAMVGKWHLGMAERFHPQRRGFEEYFGFLGGSHPYFPGMGMEPILRGTEPVAETEYLTDAFERESVAFLKQKHDRPFFLYLAFNAVHNPPHAKPEWLSKFASIKPAKRRIYAGMLAAMDHTIGQVLKTLRDAQLEQNTLVIFVSDNGGPALNGSTNTPLRGEKATTWEGGVRVPMIFRWPGTLAAGKTYDLPAIQLDFAPTVLAAAKVPADPQTQFDGVNLLPFLREQQAGAPHENLYWRFGAQMALRQGEWKLVKGRESTETELYHISNDVSEQRNVKQAHPEVAARLQQTWDAWNQTLVPPAWTPNNRVNR